ncbi:MAG: 50S ribosomal protein L44e [Candidatus Ranarchaeia archaeon]
MRIPKLSVTYCPRCNKHTEHTISQYKAGKRRPNSMGERRYTRKKEGYGSKRRPEQKKTAKVTKKIVFRRKCNICEYVVIRSGIRLKKVEIV